MSTGCSNHPALSEELREYATGALDLLEPWIEQVREREPQAGAAEPASCAVCPVCAVITVLRGGRSELAVRVAEHAAGLVAVLRAALAEGVGAPSAAGPDGAELPDGGRGVQRIPVSRGDGGAASAPC